MILSPKTQIMLKTFTHFLREKNTIYNCSDKPYVFLSKPIYSCVKQARHKSYKTNIEEKKKQSIKN